MLEDVNALFCCRHQKFQPLADLYLPGELAELWRSQRDFAGSIGFRRFHGPVSGNLITLNQKLRTTRFGERQSSLGAQAASLQSSELADKIPFLGSARVSRV